MRHIDMLVVGQGLAGSLLAWTLLRRGLTPVIVDRAEAHTTSRAAAGLVNPMAGPRLAMPARCEDYLAGARRLYRELENSLGIQFFFPKPSLRLFRSPNEVAAWRRRTADLRYRPFLGPPLAADNVADGLHAELGGFTQLGTGYLDIPLLLRQLRKYFQARNLWLTAEFAHRELRFLSDGCLWRNFHAKRVIFCEGHQGAANPWFRWLPFQCAKGEILTLDCADGGLPDLIINAGKWLLPLPNRRYRLGSTYSWSPLDTQPNPEVKEKLLQSLYRLIRTMPAFRVSEHLAGVRPATLDKSPFVGAHPTLGRLALFNGFGSKGSLLIPYHAARLADFIQHARPLPVEADIGRWSKQAGDGDRSEP